MTGRVLVVDDEPNIRRMLRALLEQAEWEVHDTGDGADILRVVEDVQPDAILLDLIMSPGPDGIAVLERVRDAHPDAVVIMMSGKATLADAVRATRLGAFQFLEKPLTPEGVLVAVRAGVDLARTRAENRELRAALEPQFAMVGDSPAMDALRRLIAQVAPTPTRVLITGESGTGKELVARAVHAESARARGPLVTVNCAAIPRELIESEMFGHERGAFTSAVARRRGKFELGHGGTLFLDEIGDLALDAQAKLLRVLETGVVERVGGDAPIEVDVRVVAATNRDLQRAVAEGAFREDLFYRLNVFPIAVPPLRERRDDIPALVAHFARAAAARCGRAPVAFENGAVDRLVRHAWPGNVRELANVVERLTILATGAKVTGADVGRVVGASPRGEPGPVGSLTGALDRYEREVIRDALGRADGNVAEAARLLSTDRANLYRRMRRLEIDPHDTGVSD